MPPQYLEQNEETNTGSIPLTPGKSGPDLRANSAVKGDSFCRFLVYNYSESLFILTEWALSKRVLESWCF